MALEQSVTIDLAAIGVDVPAGASVTVTSVPMGYEVRRREERFILERDDRGHWSLTGVVGRDRLPERVPDWLARVAAWIGIAEVRLGR